MVAAPVTSPPPDPSVQGPRALPSHYRDTYTMQPREIAMNFAHQLLDFQMQVRGFLKHHNVDLSDPKSIARFSSALGNDAAKEEVANLVSGSSSQVVTLAHSFISPRVSPLPLPTGSQTVRPTSAPSYADALRRNSPAPSNTETAPTHRFINRFPPLRTVQSEQERQFDKETVRLKKRSDQAVRRAGLSLLGHEEKVFAVVTTPDNHLPFAHPGALRNVLPVANVVDPLSVLTTDNPRRTLICTPRSALTLLKTGYDRFKALNRHQKMPPISVQPCDPLPLPTNNADSRILIAAFRAEVTRLRSPDLKWGPRFHFANTLHSVHDALVAKLRETDSSGPEQPILPFVHPVYTAPPPNTAPPNDADMLPDDSDPHANQAHKRVHGDPAQSPH